MRVVSVSFIPVFPLALLLCLTLALRAPGVAEPPGGGARVIQDMTGTGMFLDGPAKRAMIITPVAWDYLTVDNTTDNIFAVGPFIVREALANPLVALFPPLRDMETTISSFGNGMMGFEQILFMRPDAMLIWDYFARQYEAVHFPGLARVTGYGNGKEDLYAFLGRLTGKSERVAWLWDRYAQAMGGLLKRVPHDTRPVKIAVAYRDGFQVWAGFFPEFDRGVRQLNAVNCAENVGGVAAALNVETLLLLDPEVLFLAVGDFSLSVKRVREHPALQGLRAVRDGRVYYMPRGAARMEGPVERPVLYAWMLELLHPQAVPDIPLRRRIRETYAEVFGYRMSEDEIDIYLQFAENRSSLHYERFARERN